MSKEVKLLLKTLQESYYKSQGGGKENCKPGPTSLLTGYAPAHYCKCNLW